MRANPTSGGLEWASIASAMRPFVRARVPSDADADDVLQDTLLRLHQNVLDLEHEERLPGFVFRVTQRALADHHRARARHPLTRTDLTPEPLDDGEPLEEEDDALRSGLRSCVKLMVGALDPSSREALTLVDLEGMSQADAAAQLGVPLPTLKSRVQRARVKLRALFHKCCEYELDGRHKPIEYTPKPIAPSGCDGSC